MGNEKELPSGWVRGTLSDVAKWGSGGTPKSSVSEYYGGNIPWLIIGDLNDGYVFSSSTSITELGLKKSSAKMVKPDSVLLAMYGSIGKLGINKIPMATNQAIAFTDELFKVVLNRYLFFYLFSIRRDLHKIGQGGTQKNISQTILKAVEIPLSPLPEQHRIVAKIEELFSELDKGLESLKAAQQQLKLYRQAVLRWAFEGKLTEDWRQRQNKLSLAKELIEKIRTERAKSAKESAQKMKLYQPVFEEEIEEQSRLPYGWGLFKLGEVVVCLDSMRIPVNKEQRKKRVGEIPYYGANGLVGYIDDYIFDEVLILVVEDETFIGRQKPFSYKISGKTWVNNHAHVLRTEIDIDYLNYHLMFYPFLPLTTGTTGRRKLTQYALMNAPIKICSLAEQHEIVQEIEFRLSVCDKMEETINQSLVQAEALRQSILKRAFAGKLVSQDPNDEPADKLLARIRAEREKQQPKSKT